jgi:hypothetical protein
MFISVIPGFTYAVPALSGIFIWSICFFINYKWALLSYAASSLLALMIVFSMNVEAPIVYIAFFGYYPIIRDKLATVKPFILRCLIKFAIFNVMCVVIYNILVHLFFIDDMLEGMGFAGDLAVYAFWGAANLMFLCYEFCLIQLQYVIEKWIKPKFFKRIK